MRPQRTLLAAVLGVMLPLSLAAAPVNEVNLEDYRIGYDALLANGAVEDAYQLAQDVNRRFPEEQEWKRRLARVAVWTNRPLEAYNAWKELFNAGVRDTEVLGEVRRLATHYNDAPILIELWQAAETTRTMSKEEVETLGKLYERAYRPTEGARYFEQLYKTRRRAFYGLEAASLYERAGDIDDAVRVYRTLLSDNPSKGDWLLAAARLEIGRDRRAAALELLKRHQRYMPDNAFEYWQMLGDLAWLYQDDATATAAYRRATTASSATLVERDRLTYLLLDKDPMQAAAMSLRYYREGAGSIWLQRALEIQVAQKAWMEAHESLAQAKAKDRKTLEKNASFLMLRAHISQHFGDNAAAVDGMRRALGLAPDDDNVMLSALWLFIAANDRHGMAAMIAAADPQTGDPRYWAALEAAHQALGHYYEALAYAGQLLERKPKDPLLLLSYADLLQTTGQDEQAIYYRQRAWQGLKSATAKGDSERYLARIRTELADQPGDAAALRVRRLQAQSRDHAPVRQLDEVLLIWALANGQLESALAWGQQRSGKTRSLPLWAQLQLALETYDYETLQQLLNDEAENLPASSAHEAAMISGRWPLARYLAFKGAQSNPNSDELQRRLVDTTVRHGDSIKIAGQQTTYSDLDSTRVGLRADKALNQHWRLAAEAYYADQTLTSQAPLHTIPSRDRGAMLEASWSEPQQTWLLALGRHNELTDYTNWQLDYMKALDRRVQLELRIAGGQPTEHSTALQVAGYANRALISAGWAVERRLTLNAQFIGERYYTQYDTEIGNGRHITWEAAYHLRSGYPDWNIRAYGAHYRFSKEGQPDNTTLQLFSAQTLAVTPGSELSALFIPQDNDYLGLCGGAGQSLRTVYSRALRPLGEACAVHNQDSGSGYSLLAGVAGSLNGPDQLSLIWERSHAGRQAGGRDVTVITLNYQLYF